MSGMKLAKMKKQRPNKRNSRAKKTTRLVGGRPFKAKVSFTQKQLEAAVSQVLRVPAMSIQIHDDDGRSASAEHCDQITEMHFKDRFQARERLEALAAIIGSMRGCGNGVVIVGLRRP